MRGRFEEGGKVEVRRRKGKVGSSSARDNGAVSTSIYDVHGLIARSAWKVV